MPDKGKTRQGKLARGAVEFHCLGSSKQRFPFHHVQNNRTSRSSEQLDTGIRNAGLLDRPTAGPHLGMGDVVLQVHPETQTQNAIMASVPTAGKGKKVEHIARRSGLYSQSIEVACS